MRGWEEVAHLFDNTLGAIGVDDSACSISLCARCCMSEIISTLTGLPGYFGIVQMERHDVVVGCF